ncbi:hypothetical protein [Halocatena marina]|uniref:hypothetical protein n=1 Tax=Halocatena marina TaxID=2934937 RepID=UPI00200C9997|nr:hypothetical protein [Halocatena marina]
MGVQVQHALVIGLTVGSIVGVLVYRNAIDRTLTRPFGRSFATGMASCVGIVISLQLGDQVVNILYVGDSVTIISPWEIASIKVFVTFSILALVFFSYHLCTRVGPLSSQAG